MDDPSAELLRDMFQRVDAIKIDPENGKCLDCDCYFMWLFYLNEMLDQRNEPEFHGMFARLSDVLDGRDRERMHHCLGCDPCPPADWIQEMIDGLKGMIGMERRIGDGDP